MPDSLATGPVPIVVAVTGHRDLRAADLDALSERVRHVFRELRTRYPHSNIEVMSALAEGADRLAARIALDMGLGLVVPMPMEPAEYKRDFADRESVADFDELRSRASRAFVIPDVIGAGEARPECYARVGAYMVARCHVLLALWNGQPSEKVGGTAAVVAYRREGLAPADGGATRLADLSMTGVVHHIVTPRQSDPSTAGAPMTLHLLPPEETADGRVALETQHRICRDTDEFNRLSAPSRGAVERRQQSKAWLVGGFDGSAGAPVVRELLTTYACADDLAIRYQRRTLQMLRTLFLIAAGTVLIFEVFADAMFAASPWPVTLYLGLLAAAYGLYRFAARRGYDTKGLDYRALAEGLRVQFYWRLAGMPDAVADFVQSRLEDTEWIALALRRHDGTDAPVDRTNASDAATLAQVVTEWVEGQEKYFAKTSVRDATRLDACNRWTRICFGSSVVLTIAALAASWWLRGHQLEAMIKLHAHVFDAVAAAIGLTTAAGAFLESYADRRALDEHATRYARTAAFFARARRALAKPLERGDADTVRRLLRELGREALEENAAWVTIHRERPLEVPQ